MAKKRTPKPPRQWTVQEIAKAFNLTPHHTRRLVHQHVAVSDGPGTMKVPHDQVLVLRDRYLASVEPEAVEQMDRIKTIKRIK